MNRRFIESICFKEGRYERLDLHQDRINCTFDHHFKNRKSFQLTEKLPKLSFEETYKVRVVYDHETIDVEYVAYIPRKIKTLQIVKADTVDYRFKYADRDQINQLVGAAQADDIIMTKKGLITDSSYANLAFWDGSVWWTPDRPMLNGIKRRYLLERNEVKSTTIGLEELTSFKKVSFINAMLNLGDLEVPISSIKNKRSS